MSTCCPLVVCVTTPLFCRQINTGLEQEEVVARGSSEETNEYSHKITPGSSLC